MATNTPRGMMTVQGFKAGSSHRINMVLGESRLGLGLQDVDIFAMQFFHKSLISVDWLNVDKRPAQSLGCCSERRVSWLEP